MFHKYATGADNTKDSTVVIMWVNFAVSFSSSCAGLMTFDFPISYGYAIFFFISFSRIIANFILDFKSLPKQKFKIRCGQYDSDINDDSYYV